MTFVHLLPPQSCLVMRLSVPPKLLGYSWEAPAERSGGETSAEVLRPEAVGVLVVWEWSWGAMEKGWTRMGHKPPQASTVRPRSSVLACGVPDSLGRFFSFSVIFTEI